MMEGLATPLAPDRKTIIINSAYLKAHRTAPSPAETRGVELSDRKHERRSDTKARAVADANVRPISLFMTAGFVSDYTGAAAPLDRLTKAQWMLADRGHAVDWLRNALQEKRITRCIPGCKTRNKAAKYSKGRDKRRNGIEIILDGVKGWRRVVARYGRRPKGFCSAVALAAIVIFWP